VRRPLADPAIESPLRQEEREMTGTQQDRIAELSAAAVELNRQLDATHTIAVGLSSITNVGELVQQALDITLDIAQAEAGSILLHDPESDKLRFEYVVGEKKDELIGMEMAPDEGIAGLVFQTGEIHVSDDVSTEPVHLRDIGKIIVSDNGIELDAVMAAMMGMDPSHVPMLRIAGERGLGEVRLKGIETIGVVTPIENFKLPSKLMRGPFGHISWRVLTQLMMSRPVPIEDKCTQCGVCEEHCPVGAIKLKPYPEVNPEKCISCFCCMELCPESALDVTKKVKRYRGRLKY